MEPGKYRHEGSSHAAAVLHTEQVRSSYAHLPVTLAAVVINASLLFFVLAPVASPAPLQMWFAFSLLLVSLQACIWIAHKRADTAEICPRVWIVLATGGSLASGLLWGSLPWIVSPLDDAHLLFVALVVAGMCAGAATVHAAHFPTAIAYVIPAATPLALIFLLHGTRILIVAGVMTGLFTVSLCLTACNFRRWFIAITRTRVRLAQRSEALSEANARLTAEIENHRATTAQLQHAQKPEAIGRLTAGISHDFNNILTAVSGSAELAGLHVRGDPALTKYLNIISGAAERGATLTQRLLAFGRAQRLESESLDVNEVIRGMGSLLSTTLSGLAQVQLDLAVGPAVALVDKTQLEHAILNLTINARDAMPDGGVITIATETCALDGTKKPALSGRFVRIAVTDTGHGMSESDRQRAFDPFFTTKEVGKGSGLGLSHVYGLAEQSGGTATIDSEIDRGTTVAVYLPAGADVPPDRVSDVAKPAVQPRAVAGASIVLVDDDDEVRETLADILAAAGCLVQAFGSPRQALEAVKECDPVHLLVVDYAMPEMRGDELVAALRRAGMSAPALFITGYAEPTALMAETWVLKKPFRAEHLIAMTEKAILEHSV